MCLTFGIESNALTKSCYGNAFSAFLKNLTFQVFVTAKASSDKALFESNVYMLRKQSVVQMAKQEIDCYVVTLSTSTIVYKV